MLEPYGQASRDVLASDYQSGENPEEINRWLRRLHRLDDFDWQPPARFNTHQRGRRIRQLLRELGEGMGLAAPAMDLAPGECADLITNWAARSTNQWIVRDFATKKAKYLPSKSVSNFPLTTQVLATEHWTPEILEQRQRDLVIELSEAWDLTRGLPVDV